MLIVSPALSLSASFCCCVLSTSSPSAAGQGRILLLLSMDCSGKLSLLLCPLFLSAPTLSSCQPTDPLTFILSYHNFLETFDNIFLSDLYYTRSLPTIQECSLPILFLVCSCCFPQGYDLLTNTLVSPPVLCCFTSADLSPTFEILCELQFLMVE